MSGALPVTERERQLREFASRFLSWPDPDGPATTDLIPLGYPDDLPSELVDSADLRLLGSVARRRSGALLHIELLFDGPHGANDLLERYESGLLARGWRRVNQPGLHRGGFEGSGYGTASTLVVGGKVAYLQTFDMDGASDLRVHYTPAGNDQPKVDLTPEGVPGPSPLPVLKPPPGVRTRSEGHGGGGQGWSSGATARTEMAPMELEAYFAKQLETAGWGRVAGSADEFFAWSSWLLPRVPPTAEWHGVLIVLAAQPGERHLSLRADRMGAR